MGQGTAGDATIAVRYTTAEFHYPTDFMGQPVDSNAYRVQHRLTVSLDAGRNLGPSVQARFLAGSNDVADLTEDIAIPFGGTTPQHSAFRSRGYRRNAEGRVSLFLANRATLTVGAAYEREHENSSNVAGDVGGPSTPTDSFDASRQNTAYYSELLGNVSRLSYTISGRVDDNSDYQRFSTYRIGANVAVAPRLRLRASVSSAFNAPAFNQLRPTLYTLGSPGLGPEKIRSAELGFVANMRETIRISGAYFNQEFADLIQFVSGGPPSFKGSYDNLTSATANGYEAELEVESRRGLRGSASYTVVNPRVNAISAGYSGSDRAGDALIRRPSHSGKVVAAFTAASGISVSASVAIVGKRPDIDFAQFPSPRITLPGYTKTDASVEIPLSGARDRGVTLTARVENLFDKEYEDVLYFRAPGRILFAGARAVGIF
jgi:vitamin B12 transporter